jgi:hypothetical protein
LFELQENQIPHAIFENKTKEPQINLLKKFHVNCSNFQGFAIVINNSITIAMISNKCNPSWPCEHPTHMHILGLILPSIQERFFFSLMVFEHFKQNLVRFVASINHLILKNHMFNIGYHLSCHLDFHLTLA